MANTSIRRQLQELNDECRAVSVAEGWVGPSTGNPNFRLLYSSVESFEAGNRIAIVGINPAGGREVADVDDPDRPFREPGYSAYLDDEWLGSLGRGQDPLQRVIQEFAMILTGATPAEAMAARADAHSAPELRTGAAATDLLRNAPSGNIIPFRGSKLDEVPARLRVRGEEMGWTLLSLARPRPRIILTLANGVRQMPWKTILRNSGQPLRADDEEWIHVGLKRKYREVRLQGGPLAGATVIGLPAVVRDRGRNGEVVEAMFRIVAERVGQVVS